MSQEQTNWEYFTGELMCTKREHIGALIGYLESGTDFRVAPASTKFHLCEPEGLLQHSLNVLRFARLVNQELKLSLPEDQITIVSLLHDLCKANFYVKGEEWDKDHKDKTNEWRKKEVWKVDDQLPLGHGEKSVIMAVRYIDLTVEEMAAIRWHLSGFDAGIQFFFPSGAPYRAAVDKFPLVKLLAIADQMADLFESFPPKQ